MRWAAQISASCQTAVSFEGNAELLVYLVDEGKDIYIGVLVALVATLLAGRSPAESLSCLGVAESLRTGKWRSRRGLYRTGRKEDLDTLLSATSEKGLELFLGRQEVLTGAGGKFLRHCKMNYIQEVCRVPSHVTLAHLKEINIC